MEMLLYGKANRDHETYKETENIFFCFVLNYLGRKLNQNWLEFKILIKDICMQTFPSQRS